MGNYLWDLEQEADLASAEGRQPLVEEIEAKILRQAERAQRFPPSRRKPSNSGRVCRRSGVSDDPALAEATDHFRSGSAAFSNERGGLARAYLVPCGTWPMGRMRNGGEEIR